MKDKSDVKGAQTKAIHADHEWNSTRALSPPIWQTTTFRADSTEQFVEAATTPAYSEFYTRYGNPTLKQVGSTIAALEGGEAALVLGSGMGAIFAAVMSVLQSGDHVVAQRNHYAGATALLRDVAPRWGIETTFVDQTSVEAFADSIRPNTKLIYTESPTNPLMQITDLARVADLGRRCGIMTMVDNTFATPINQRPLELGIDVVLHSGTKYLGGHHDVTAGVLVASREFVERTWSFAIVAGAVLGPFDGWLLLRGLRTLGVRVERHNRNALSIARFLEAHPKVERVYYPGLESHAQHHLARQQMSGFTGMLSVELRRGYEAAKRFISSLRLASYAASLGGVETLVVHPAAMWSHQISPEQRLETGLSESLVRISVGLEDERDLLDDFAQALEQ
ncbi:MAG TPA: aminotransferase class I/II-fold pyridoxal phosphate-dependent enzyme [Pyrinomonadaceae bacterium]|nr:aminotransferase class I/II-fold pyridoxal phosphate-dependent enzyme [Pyrinomonadaceae bacterium]